MMKRIHYPFMLVLLAAAAPAAADTALPPVLRGAGAVLLRPEPGALTLTIRKRDLNIYAGADTLTAVLLDPQRRTLATAALPDDGNDAKGGRGETVQSETLRVECRAPGVYRLMITGSGDTVWGFETNCPRCAIQGVTMLNDAEAAGQMWFRPPAGPVRVAAAALHPPGKQSVPLRDASGKLLRTLDLTREAVAELFGPGSGRGYVAGEHVEIPAEEGDRSGPWCLEIAHMDARVEVAGVTAWAPARDAWFDAAKARWMLYPYARARHLKPGEKAEMTFRLRNATGAAGRFRLSLLPAEGVAARLLAPASPVTLAKDGQQEVRVEVSLAPGATLAGEARAALVAAHETDPDAVANAGIVVRTGEAPARRPLSLPIVLKPYEHENLLLGYAPDYMTNEVHFDPANRPYIRQRTENLYPSTGLMLLEPEGWVERSFIDAIRAAVPDYVGTHYGGGFLGAKVAFDGRGGAYTLVKLRLKDGTRPGALLFTPDRGRSYQVVTFPAGDFDIEQFTGHNALQQPPPILCYVPTREHPARFCGYHDLFLYLPRREGDRVTLGEPVRVSDNCLGSCQHSGGPASTATRGGKTHIVCGEVAPDDAKGVPTYAATFDHATRTLGPKVFLAYAPPVNDVHNVPAITLDRAGYLHVVTGAHGEAFQYLRSLKPNDTAGGFTPPTPVSSEGCVDKETGPRGRGRQTYISLVCGPDDTLHLACRQWRAGVDPYHDGQLYAALSYQRKPKDGPWQPGRPLVVPPLPGYSIYYHKLTLDRAGRLFLAYAYLSGEASYRDDFPDRCHNQAVMLSADGGNTWKLAETADFRGLGR